MKGCKDCEWFTRVQTELQTKAEISNPQRAMVLHNPGICMRMRERETGSCCTGCDTRLKRSIEPEAFPPRQQQNKHQPEQNRPSNRLAHFPTVAAFALSKQMYLTVSHCLCLCVLTGSIRTEVNTVTCSMSSLWCGTTSLLQLRL